MEEPLVIGRQLRKIITVGCARCGRTIPVDESAEAGLVAENVMVEFYHCADRKICEQSRPDVAEEV
jgi:hypothetical protein